MFKGAQTSSTRANQVDGTQTATVKAKPSRVLVRVVWTLAVVSSLVLIGHALLTPAAVPHTIPSEGTALPPAGLVGHQAPVVTLEDLASHPANIVRYRGQILVLNFWYVACEPCRYEMPIFERVFHTDRSKGVVIVGVNIADDAQSISAFTSTLGIDYPILRDTSQQSVVSYAVTVTPTTFVIDQRGVIRAIFPGAITDSTTLNKAISPLLPAN